MNLEDQLIEWGRWCWEGRRSGVPRGASLSHSTGLVSSIRRFGDGESARGPSAVIAERVQHAIAQMVHRHQRPELGHALGAWYVWALSATTTTDDAYGERVEIASQRCSVSVRTFPELLVQARTAIAMELRCAA